MTDEPQLEEPRRSALARAWSGWPGWIARVVLAVLPLIWLAHILDVEAVLAALGSTGWPVLLLTLAIFFAGLLIGATRWQVLLRAYGAAAPPGVFTLFRHSIVGVYYSILPGGLAGDVVRAYRVQGALSSMGTSLAVILVDRVCGFVGLLTITVAGMLVEQGKWDNQVVLALDVGVACAILFMLVFLALPHALRRHEAWRDRVAAIPVLGGMIRRIPPARSVAGIALAVALSVVTQGLAVCAICVLAASVHPAGTLTDFVRVVPLIVLLSYIPLTPAGVGQQELVSLYFFGLVGVPGESAVAISLLRLCLGLTIVLLGGVTHLAERVLGLNPRADPARSTADPPAPRSRRR
jgi:uncharacterized membrane protein YbhN (UPF0104 family)